MRKSLLAATLIAVAMPIAPVAADPPPWAPARGYRAKNYNNQNYAPAYRNDNGVRYWQGQDGRYYCKRSNGTVGLLIGGVAGALVGRAIDTRGERTTGTIVGAAAGALLGREVDRNRGQARCR